MILTQYAASVPPETERLVREALMRELAGMGVEEIELVSIQDQDGDPVILATISHPLSDVPIDLQRVRSADRAARTAARQTGEGRFMHIRHVYDDKQQVKLAS